VNFEVIMAIIKGQGESVVKEHTEHKIKRKKRAGIEYPYSRDGE